MSTPTPEHPEQPEQPAGHQPPPAPPFQQQPFQQPPFQQQPFQQQPYRTMAPDQERTWAGAAHWGCVIGAFVALALLAPLIIMLVKGNESPFVRRHAVESLNFQISMLIYLIVSVVLVFVIVGIFMLVGLAILWLVCVIVGSVKASNGEEYRYPLAIRFVS